jgi:hypothetical protein
MGAYGHVGHAKIMQPKHPLIEGVKQLETQLVMENAVLLPASSMLTNEISKGHPFDEFFKQEGEDLTILIL